jgi:tetratricopeptide (TPR) repeat protein
MGFGMVSKYRLHKLFRLPMEWFDRHRVIRELRVFDEQVRGHSRTYLEDEIGRARDALFSGNQEEAFTIWRQMRRLFPTLSMTSKAGLALLLDLGAYDEADAMMRDGRRRYPGYADFAAGYAEVAHRRGDLEEALLRCGIVRQKFPDTAKGYTIAAACLAGLDRHQEAEAIIERAVLRLPHDYDVLVEHARHAMRRQDWQEALQRWRIMKNSFDLPIAPINMAECLRLMGSYAEAGVIATETCERYPGNHWALSGLANIAAASGDLERAVQCWEAVRRRSPFFALGYTEGADAVRRVGREVEADTILGEGVTRVKSDLRTHLEYARSAQSRGDWSAAADRWALVRQRFPDCDEGREQADVAWATVQAQKQDSGRFDDQAPTT